MGLLDGIKRSLVANEVRRLLIAYQPTLTRFGITVQVETCVQEVIRLYEAKGGSDADDPAVDG